MRVRFALALCVGLLPSSAWAQTEPPSGLALDEAAPATQPRFGGEGQWAMLGTSNGLSAFHETFSGSGAAFSNVGAFLGLDYFVLRHFSLGVDLGASYSANRGYGVNTFVTTKSTSLTGGVRLGYDMPLGDLFSWYPRLTLGVASTHDDDGHVDGSSSSFGPVANLYAPLLLHVAPHFFVGFGPRVQHSFGTERGGVFDGTRSTLVGGELAIGGWWGDRTAPVEVSAQAESDDAPFGQRGQLVLGLATDASLSYRFNSASTYSRTVAELVPSADYFVLDHFSVGVDAFVSHTSGTSLDAFATPTDFESNSVGVAPRIGSNVSIGKRGNFWPQVELGVGTLFTNISSTDGTNQHSSKRSWLRLSAPVLIKITSHFALGGGPYYFYEISNTDQNGVENRGEGVGARLLMAGWFDIAKG